MAKRSFQLIAALMIPVTLYSGCSRPDYRVIEKHVATTTAATLGQAVMAFPLPMDMPDEADRMYRLCVQDVKKNHECDP
jgi:hypothetical protein